MSNIQRTEEEILTDAFYGVDNSQSSGTNEEELDDEAPEAEEVEEITEEESEVNEETGEVYLNNKNSEISKDCLLLTTVSGRIIPRYFTIRCVVSLIGYKANSSESALVMSE